MGSSYHAAGGDVYNVAKIILHPNYDYFELRNDACILVLEQTPLTPCKSLWLKLGFPAGLSRPGKSREGPGTGTGQDRT